MMNDRNKNRGGFPVKGMIKAIAILCLIALLPAAAFADDSYSMRQDGFSTSYSYIYDIRFQ